jgi:putative phosphoesterase
MACAATIGIISDTHGLVRPEAIDALRGSDLIVHAGDVGDAQVLKELRVIAPTRAVRGNVDTDPWARVLPETDVVEIASVRLYVLHDRSRLRVEPESAGFAAVIFGHSHRPGAETRDGVLYLNPGSAGPRRFSLPITVARLRIDGTALSHEIIPLQIPPVSRQP